MSFQNYILPKALFTCLYQNNITKHTFKKKKASDHLKNYISLIIQYKLKHIIFFLIMHQRETFWIHSVYLYDWKLHPGVFFSYLSNALFYVFRCDDCMLLPLWVFSQTSDQSLYENKLDFNSCPWNKPWIQIALVLLGRFSIWIWTEYQFSFMALSFIFAKLLIRYIPRCVRLSQNHSSEVLTSYHRGWDHKKHRKTEQCEHASEFK